ncbi:metallophosphoesterase family protein [Clostridium fungisolvens]|uniref:3',5'-cyclic adenosine monophosphate phosphodiesterase CpdA n=1 Tax=Clostridium fungisolvens TaxID=1604897 RepID=A0A6V8SKL2_9CLOT|nr:DNA repair exonuclease [Clostridium fungisolvens]GFP77301.1 3',5'-cyclic adenosine monophosphate phosphodiesterase CpdA [Clostridium fungisolvens]
MDKVKILHCSDLHFDTPFTDLSSDIAEQRKEELQDTFSSIIELASNENVDAILLAGDIFDNLRVRKSTLDLLRKKLEGIPNIEVFIAPGNHDPNNDRSFYSMINWPSNVHIFGAGFIRYKLKGKNVVVYGAGFTGNYVKRSMLRDFKVDSEDEGSIKLMVLHGEVENGNNSNEYNPITTGDIENSSMNYIALGHRHQFSQIKRAGNTLYAYCGCPEGRGFDELGEKGIILGEVGLNFNTLKFIPTNKRTYMVVHVNISDAMNYDDIKEKILEVVNEESRIKDLYKIILTGEIHEDFNIDLEVMLNKLVEYFYFIKLEDSTKIKMDIAEVIEEHSVKGIFAKKVMEKMDECTEDEKSIYELALKIGIQSLSEGEIRLNDN